MPPYDAHQFQPPAPVATVTLCTRDGQNRLRGVMMQIDSASDVSLIPESLTRQLGLIAREEEDCEVQAYDGTRSVARSVECELIFLRRAFAGTYLVMEGPIGILGRDILNYVSLVLDGPRLEWKEEHSAE